MTETSTSSNKACTYTRHFRSRISPFKHASKVTSSIRNGIGVLIVVTAAVRFWNARSDILTIWCHSETASTATPASSLTRGAVVSNKLLITLTYVCISRLRPADASLSERTVLSDFARGVLNQETNFVRQSSDFVTAESLDYGVLTAYKDTRGRI